MLVTMIGLRLLMLFRPIRPILPTFAASRRADSSAPLATTTSATLAGPAAYTGFARRATLA